MAGPTEQGVESSLLKYYDIMVIGKTGMGKSTTMDKMIIAKLPDAREQSSSTSQDGVPVYSAASQKLECNDLTMWLVSDKPADPEQDYRDDNLEKVTLRLKNLVFFRCLENPHLEVNQARDDAMGIYESTLECELLSNEQTKIRVLDIPGFFGIEMFDVTLTQKEWLKNTAESVLANMRKVLRINYTHNLKFSRVVYFLPEQGALKRTSQSLVAELQIMEKYFGRAIFDSMVVIATVSSIVFRHVSAKDTIFSEEDFRQTKRHFQEALKIVFNGGDIPDPPIEFISLLDTCEDVLNKIQSAEVLKPQIELEFKKSVCARCGLTIMTEEDSGEPAYCMSPNHVGAIAYEESTCHPIMIPRYTKSEKLVGGILHLFTHRRFVGMWPNFKSMDEVCVECKQPPLSAGCLKIGTKYPGAKDDKVGHSSSAIETYKIEIEEEDETVPADQKGAAEASIAVAVGPSSPVEGIPDSSTTQYISRDGTVPADQGGATRLASP